MGPSSRRIGDVNAYLFASFARGARCYSSRRSLACRGNTLFLPDDRITHLNRDLLTSAWMATAAKSGTGRHDISPRGDRIRPQT
jgi:hypothetical protein